MLVSFPLLAARRQVFQAIATSGVSDLDDDAAPSPAWRAHGTAANPYLVPPQACPECGAPVVRASACLMCPGCGWGKCG
jgi:hypothetical protein